MTRDFADPSLLDELTGIASRAGEAIMRVRKAGTAVRTKSDSSPVTEADEAAEAIILHGLAACAAGHRHRVGRSRVAGIRSGIARYLHPGRSARRYPGIHRRPRRVHRQYCHRAQRATGHGHRWRTRAEMRSGAGRSAQDRNGCACRPVLRQAPQAKEQSCERTRIEAGPGARWSAARISIPRPSSG